MEIYLAIFNVIRTMLMFTFSKKVNEKEATKS